jgi:hypothetical protein
MSTDHSKRKGSSEKGAASSSRRLWRLFIALFVADVLALIVVVAAVGTPRNTFQFELAKGLIQVGLVVVLGAALSLLVEQNRREREAAEKERDRDHERAEKQGDLDRERREYREELIKATLARATASYSAVKRARRLMRARAFVERDGAGSIWVVAEPYDAQMVEINNAQLEFESLARDVKTSASLFSDVDAVKSSLDTLESYLNRIITEYESERRHFAGEPPQLELERLPRLMEFLAPKSVHFGWYVVRNLAHVQRLLRRDLLSEPVREAISRPR